MSAGGFRVPLMSSKCIRIFLAAQLEARGSVKASESAIREYMVTETVGNVKRSSFVGPRLLGVNKLWVDATCTCRPESILFISG